MEMSLNSRRLVGFSNEDDKNPLIDRIFDKGIGGKFNEFSAQKSKGAAVKSFLTNFDDIDTLHNDPKYITNVRSGVDTGKNTQGLKLPHSKRTHNKLNQPELNTEKVNLLSKKFDTKMKEPILDSIDKEEGEKSFKNIQDLESITGFKTMNQLPPSRGVRYNSVNPMERLRIVKKDEKIDTVTKFSKIEKALDPKLSRPTTTIVALNKVDTAYIKNATISQLDSNLIESENKFRKEDINKAEEDKIMASVNFAEKEIKMKNDNLGYDEDQYMDKINKFIKEAFEGKDYRINFVYYLPSGKENFYELKPTTFENINKEKVYYTLSAKGLTVYIDKKPREFIKLSEWIIERQGYNYVADISFFKNFKIWRILKIWRKNIFKQKKIAYQNELANTLLFNNKDYNQRICYHKEKCNLILKEKILDLRVGLESISFDDFRRKQVEARRKLRMILNEIHKKCEENFVFGIKAIFSDVQRKINIQNNEANYNDDDTIKKKKRMAAASAPTSDKVSSTSQTQKEDQLLSDDNIVGFENYPYKFKMMIKNECLNFIKMAFLFDYIMLDVLRRTYIFSMNDTLKRLEDFNFVEPPVNLRENVLNKREEYVKPTVNSHNRVIPYFLVKCLLDEKPIENRDRVKLKVKPFYVRATPDDDFDPTAHLQKDYEEEELLALAGEKSEDITTTDESNKIDRDSEITIEIIERPHHYFIRYDPDLETLIHSFIKQVDDGFNELKVPRWRAHKEFSKYLHYLENWDDRYADWTSGDDSEELHPQEILSLSEDPLFLEKNDLLEAALKTAYKKCDNYLQKLNPYLQLHWKQMKINKNLLLIESLKDADEMMRLLFYYTEKNIRTLQRWIPYEEELGMVKLTLETTLRKEIIENQSNVINFLKPLMPNILRERAHRIERWISEMFRSIQGSIENEKQYLDKTKSKENLDQWFYFYERKLNTCDTIVTLLRYKNFDITQDDAKNIEVINSMKYSLKVAWDELNDNLTRNKDKLKMNMLNISIPSLLKETKHIDDLLKEEDKFITYDRITGKSLIPSYITELESYENMFKGIERNKNTYNDLLKVLGEPDYNFDQVLAVHENLKILKNLWNALKDFDEECDDWKKTKFSEIDTEKIIKRIDDYYTHGKKAELQFGDNGSAIKELLTNVNNFRESMQVINDLNSPYLKSHHWERIQNLFPDISQRLEHKDYPLDDLLQIKAYEHQKVINEIALEAKNHDELKSKMAEIMRMKNAIMFTVVVENDAYKTFQKLEEVVEKIEECQSKLNNVLASRYVRLLKSETAGKGDDPYTIKSDLDGSLELIEDIKAFQSKWRYLNNILNAPGSSGSDIRKKIPDNNFDKIDNEWKNIMNKLNDPPSVLLFYGKMRRGQENFFQKNLYQLEQIQLKIEQYLTSMRGLFERFFFISNDDLLYMLSNSSAEKINEIKPYLMKIFEDISDLLIPKSESSNVASKEITAVISASKEELYFEKNFEKKTVKLSEKLEEWLRNLEVMIVSTLKEKMNYGFVAFADITKDPVGHESWLEKISVSKENKDNVNMVTENISQVIATVTHVMFCDNTEAAITMQRVESTSLTQWYKKIETAIKTYARMVNKDFASKNMRRIISNLITHHVHYLEICRNLCVEEPYNTDDFIWQQQLRGYILPSEVEKTPVVRIKQLKSDMEYGYEYIGPSSRVVITPLTDRVWLTMTSALHIKLGCSLGGPAGTGKTETTKDLAKFFGIQCIVFNCSEQIDYKILGNIFSGLCAHKQGAYACLDEFNRINVEVLSVVATQLFVITQSLLAMVPGEPPKQIQILPPSMVELVGKLGVFITMNPTYSGRTELPDNLKSSFRPITMMVPDFLTISEVRLYSEGFTESKALAKKITKLYALASQQLSQQDHYDFTLRTVGTVLSMAGNLKRQFKPSGSGREKKDEELILLNALRDANFPKFVAEDVQLFKALLTDLFPESQLTEPTLEVFENEVKSIIQENNLHDSHFSIKKSLQLFDIINIRLGVCLTGGAGSGKSTCISLVEKAMTNLRVKGDPDPRYKEVVKSTINPKSITMGELYGQENDDTKTFVFGICTIKIKEALALDQDNSGNKYGWVVLDGPIDTMWVENMNSVLDDSMTLCLSNGERIKLKPHVKILFEVEDLSRASLATVSRLGIVYFGAHELGWRPYFYSWMKKVFHDESVFSHEMKNFLIQIFEDKVDESIENVDDLFNSGCIFIKPVAVQCVKSLCNFLEILYTRDNGFIGKDTPNLDNQDNMSRIKKKIVSVFAFSMIWGVFGGVNNKGYHKIESYVRNKFVEIKMENSQLIMEHYFDFHKNDFVKYSTEGSPFNYVRDMPYFSIFVPTIDTLRYSSIFELLIRQQKNVFVTGETGVGKTAILLNVLNKLLATEEFTHIQMNFSAQTSSEDTQKSLESKLEPKTGKKILGAKGGKKLTIFIDDINMPEPNDWGAHPPIELLRQYVDQGGFYDRPKFFWKRIEDACLFVCGGPPIGGRSKLTDRFGRHFNIISLPQPSRTVLISIFENILKGFLNHFNEYVKNAYVEATLGSIELFEFVCDQMKPHPS
jgi:dynein heavy chain, axonemal